MKMPVLVTNGIPLLTALPFALAFVWLAVGIGRRVLRLLGASNGDGADLKLTPICGTL
jgi:hypothetical protein